MKRLEKLILVQFFVCDAEEININGHTAFLGPNGTGKSALLDAIQIVMLGADQKQIAFNVKQTARSEKQEKRSIRDYCLGSFRPPEESSARSDDRPAIARRKRNNAHTYITLVFRDDKTGEAISAGVHFTARADDEKHIRKGLYLVRGHALSLDDHTQVVGAETRPLVWSDFTARIRQQADIKDATVQIVDGSGQFVSELLHALQPASRSINVADYQKSFRSALDLKHVADVNTFVRTFIVEEMPIDKAAAMQQVNAFNELRNYIAETEEKIVALTEIAKHGAAAVAACRRYAGYSNLIAVYRVEQTEEKLYTAEDQRDDAKKQLASLEQEALDIDEQLAVANKDVETLVATFSSDHRVIELEGKRELLQSCEKRRREAERHVRTMMHQIATGASKIQSLVPPGENGPVKRALLDMETLLTQEGLGDLQTLLEKIVAAQGSILEATRYARQELKRLQQAAQAAADEVTSLKQNVEHQRKGGAELPATVALAMAALRQEGIDAVPLCERLEIADPIWQQAIESYLGQNRFALIVPENSTDRAVSRIRRPGARIDGVKIIQISQIPNEMYADPAATLAASLLRGTDRDVVAYARMQIGRLKMVSTEEDLRRERFAITRDGVVSKGAATFTLKLLLPAEFVIGRETRKFDEGAYRQRIREAEDLSTREERNVRSVETAIEAARKSGGDIAEVRTDAESRIRLVQTTATEMANLEGVIGALDSTEVSELRAARDAKEQQRKALFAKSKELSEQIGQAKTAITSEGSKISECEAALVHLRAKQAETAAMPYFDAMQVDELRQRYDVEIKDDPGKLEVILERLLKTSNVESQRSESAKGDLLRAFDAYASNHRIEYIDDRGWEAVYRKVSAMRKHLEESDLVRYKEDAERARTIAEEAFRRDVIFKLKDGINRMSTSINAVNRLLRACPRFSNDESYEFDWKVPAIYGDLYKQIMNASEMDSVTDLFGNSSEVSNMIFAMLSADANKGERTPLDDYRLLFNFDLKILVNGVPFTTLSSRIGRGSNGEHLTPFYVISAAALTHAYRLDQDKARDGVGLILLDEAFGAVDDQNALAVARFMNTLGLQMIMAAPSADLPKLSSFTNTIYEMDRYEGELEFSYMALTDDGNTLFASDMPSQHPELIQQRALEIEQRVTSPA